AQAAINDKKAVRKLICILATPGSADGFCSSSDPALLICSGIWGLFSLIALIAYCRWHGDHSSARYVPTNEPPGLLPHTQAVNERALLATKVSLFDHLIGERQQFVRDVRPSVFAVLRLITSSNLVGCTTGISDGFSPLRIRPVSRADH